MLVPDHVATKYGEEYVSVIVRLATKGAGDSVLLALGITEFAVWNLLKLSFPSCVSPSPCSFLWHLPGGQKGMSLRAEKVALCCVESSGRVVHCRNAVMQCRGIWECTGLVLLRKRLMGVEVLACLVGGIPSQLHDFCCQKGRKHSASHRIYVYLEQSHLSDKCRERMAIYEVQWWVRRKRALCSWWNRVGWDRVVLEKKGPAFLKCRADKCLRWLQGFFLCPSAYCCC